MTVQPTRVAELPHHAGVPAVHPGTIFSPRLDGLGVSDRRIWDHQLLVVLEHAAETFADGARPERTVEGEHPRFEFGQRAFRVQLTRKGFTERVVGPLAVVFHAGNERSITKSKAGFNRISKPIALARLDDHPVKHCFDVVHFVTGQTKRVGTAFTQRITEIMHGAVDADPNHALPLQLFQHFTVVPLLGPNDGGHQQHPRAFGEVLQRVGDLGGVGSGDRPATHFAVLIHMPTGWGAGPGKEQAKVVPNFRGGGHGGSGVVSSRALLDRNGGGEAFDGFHVGLAELIQELPGVGRQRFHVFALTFGVHRVKGQRALPGAGGTGNDHQLVARDVQVHVFEVVLPRATDRDGVGGGHGM